MPHAICYISNAITLLEQDELYELFHQSTRANTQKSLTGILVYKEGTFFQLLEGKDDEVTNLFEIIKNDSRHNQITKMLDRTISTTLFDEYKTSFSSLYTTNDLEQLDAFLNQHKNSSYGKSMRALLKPFVGLHYA